MRKNWKFSLMAFIVASTTIFTSCSDEDPIAPSTGEGGETTGDETVELKGNLTEDLTLTKDKVYMLNGGYTVKAGATLAIEPGVEITAIDDNDVDFILIEQGAKIMAEGTASEPIVLTAELKKQGGWAGIHICGKAPINKENATSEVGDASYGGSATDDNSGILKYVRVEYAGYSWTADKEGNGFSFYGVGNGTTVDYCQAYKGSDDGFEFFGGTVNVKHLISTSNSDDSFDWTQGWRGNGQFMLAVQEDGLAYKCDRLMECDNNGGDFEAEPCSRPTLSNLTLIGTNPEDKQHGITLRAGTHIRLYNALVAGKPNGLEVQTPETDASLSDASSVINSVLLATQFINDGSYEDESGQDATGDVRYQLTDFKAGGNEVYYDVASVLNGFRGVVTTGATDVSKVDSWFDAANYIGAVDPSDDWTAGGWAIVDGEASIKSSVVALKGELSTDLTLTSNNTYKLYGGYTVKAPAVLTIEPGVKIEAVDDNDVDFILIEKGAQIIAKGTKELPIIMTSELKKQGGWAGIHICGDAPVNKDGATSEVGASPYGGSNEADNSGALEYVVVKYAGYSWTADKEGNGFSFYGVGNGTTVDYCQAFMGSDDGFEFFGGTVNVKHLVSTSNSDDSFDWTQGWRGNAQFMLAVQESGLDYKCDRLMECDNNGGDFDADPYSRPTFSNVTLIGANPEDKQHGITLRAGTHIRLYNTLLTGKPYGLEVQTPETDKSLEDGTSIIKGVFLASDFVNDGSYNDETESKQQGVALFTLDDFMAAGNKEKATLPLEGFIGTQTEGAFDITTLADPFFDQATYAGAVKEGEDWTAGWTVWNN